MNTIENTGSNFHHLPNLHVRGHSGSLSLNQKEPGDTIETTRHSFFDNEKFWTRACDQLKPRVRVQL